MPPAVPSASGRTSQAPWSNPTTAEAPAEGAPLVVATRPFDGILTGLAASALAGVLWWAGAAAIIEKQPDFGLWPLGSILVGLLVGVGVLVGSRRGGLVSGLIALVLSTAAALVTVYFIDRTITISAFADAGRTELAEKETAEAGVITEYLPEQLDSAAIVGIVTAAVEQTGAAGEGMRAMGKVMAVVQPQVKGRADGGFVAAEVKRQLA